MREMMDGELTQEDRRSIVSAISAAMLAEMEEVFRRMAVSYRVERVRGKPATKADEVAEANLQYARNVSSGIKFMADQIRHRKVLDRILGRIESTPDKAG